jgi:hypothetical protein
VSSYPFSALPDPPQCPRCGAAARVDWVDVTTLGDPEPVVMPNRTTCPTPGCHNQLGHSTVAWPPQPGELTLDDQDWVDWQLRLAKEQA